MFGQVRSGLVELPNWSHTGLNPLAAREFFFIFLFANLIKNTYYWLDQGKK